MISSTSKKLLAEDVRDDDAVMVQTRRPSLTPSLIGSSQHCRNEITIVIIVMSLE